MEITPTQSLSSHWNVQYVAVLQQPVKAHSSDVGLDQPVTVHEHACTMLLVNLACLVCCQRDQVCPDRLFVCFLGASTPALGLLINSSMVAQGPCLNFWGLGKV